MPANHARPTTLPALLAATVAAHGDAAAATDAACTLTWRALAARAEAYAGQLHDAGITAGGRVAVWLPNSPDYLALIFATARLGAVCVHVNTRFRAHEVGMLLRRTQATVLVTDWQFPPVDFATVLAETDAADRAHLRRIIACHASPGTALGLPLEALAGQNHALPPDAAAPDAPCLTYTTSGTTSGPKLVLHNQRAIAVHAQDAARALGLDAPGAVLLAAVPLCGTFGNAAAMAAVAGAAHLVCMDRFDATEAARLIRHHRVTHAVGGDDMLGRVAEAAQGLPFETMRLFGFAAFHPTAAASIAAAEAMRLAPRGLYGSSEVQALFSVSPDAARLSPGGTPVSAAAVFAIRDPDSGAEMPDGTAGELCIRAPSQFLHYLDNPDATARATTADGLFRTGDLCHRDGAGFVFHARIGDTLRLGGFLVNPEEIEAFLQTVPGVAAAQVVGATAGDVLRAVAFVRMAPGAQLNEAATLALCRARLARYKVPARILALSAFPMTDSPNGPKIQRVKLREMAATILAS